MTIFSFDYPPNHGGIARLCGEIVRGLEKREKNVTVITQCYEKETNTNYLTTYTVSSVRPKRELEAYLKLKRLREGVMAGIWYPEGLIALLSGSRPLVILAHGLELLPSRQRWRRPLWKQLCRHVLEKADLVIANSSYTKELAIRAAPGATVKMNKLAVDHHRFRPGKTDFLQHLRRGGRKIVTTVSRLESYKGHDTVLRAMAELEAEIRKKIVYLVAGKGPELPELRTLTARLGLEEQVHFLGFVPEEKLPDLYRMSDLFVLCTREEKEKQHMEGFGLVFLEAQACGTPVIGTRTGGIPDAVDHQNGGWLIEQDDHTALTGLLNQLVSNPEQFKEEGKKARERVEEQFTWNHYIRRLITLLHDAGID